MYSPTRECHDRPGLPSYKYVTKACAEHALPTCVRGCESTKAQGPTCFSCQGLSLGAAEDWGNEDGVRKATETLHSKP